MKKIVISALLIRIILSFFVHHPDTLDFLGWSKDIRKNGLPGIYFRDVDDAGPANYPPVYYIYLALNNFVYDEAKSILWTVNNKFSVFPSNLYLFFESDFGKIWFNKLTPITFDLGTGYLIFRIIKEYNNSQIGLRWMAFYLFTPPSWYISSLWGQTDSIYIFLLLLSLYFLINSKNNLSLTSITLSLLIKPTAVFILPVYILYLFKKEKIGNLWPGLTLSVTAVVLSAGYFLGNINILKIAGFYLKYVREISGYISSNAFNFWGMIYGFGPHPDSIKLFGIGLFNWGAGLYFLILLYLYWKKQSYLNNKNLFYVIFLASYASFILLTRMHERYFYLTYTFFIIITAFYPRLKKYLYIAGGIFVLNLYHYWWYPYSQIMKTIFSLTVVEALLCAANIIIFLRIFNAQAKIN